MTMIWLIIHFQCNICSTMYYNKTYIFVASLIQQYLLYLSYLAKLFIGYDVLTFIQIYNIRYTIILLYVKCSFLNRILLVYYNCTHIFPMRSIKSLRKKNPRHHTDVRSRRLCACVWWVQRWCKKFSRQWCRIGPETKSCTNLLT